MEREAFADLLRGLRATRAQFSEESPAIDAEVREALAAAFRPALLEREPGLDVSNPREVDRLAWKMLPEVVYRELAMPAMMRWRERAAAFAATVDRYEHELAQLAAKIEVRAGGMRLHYLSEWLFLYPENSPVMAKLHAETAAERHAAFALSKGVVALAYPLFPIVRPWRPGILPDVFEVVVYVEGPLDVEILRRQETGIVDRRAPTPPRQLESILAVTLAAVR